MLRILVSGICGRTGSMVARAVAAGADMELAAGLERDGHPLLGSSLRDVVQGASEGVLARGFEELQPGSVDVIIDFSAPDQAVRCAEFAARTKKGLVIGTTGLKEGHVRAIREASRSCAVVLAPNTGVGANLLFREAAAMAEATGPEFDIEIVEVHHSGKKDAPSGTALRIAEEVTGARGVSTDDVVVTGRSGSQSQRHPGEVGISSVRGGGVTGVHSVHFMSQFETLTIKHVVHSREAFAAGAVLAARFAATAVPGLYGMDDVLEEASGRKTDGGEGR